MRAIGRHRLYRLLGVYGCFVFLSCALLFLPPLPVEAQRHVVMDADRDDIQGLNVDLDALKQAPLEDLQEMSDDISEVMGCVTDPNGPFTAPDGTCVPEIDPDIDIIFKTDPPDCPEAYTNPDGTITCYSDRDVVRIERKFTLTRQKLYETASCTANGGTLQTPPPSPWPREDLTANYSAPCADGIYGTIAAGGPTDCCSGNAHYRASTCTKVSEAAGTCNYSCTHICGAPSCSLPASAPTWDLKDSIFACDTVTDIKIQHGATPAYTAIAGMPNTVNITYASIPAPGCCAGSRGVDLDGCGVSIIDMGGGNCNYQMRCPYYCGAPQGTAQTFSVGQPKDFRDTFSNLGTNRDIWFSKAPLPPIPDTDVVVAPTAPPIVTSNNTSVATPYVGITRQFFAHAFETFGAGGSSALTIRNAFTNSGSFYGHTEPEVVWDFTNPHNFSTTAHRAYICDISNDIGGVDYVLTLRDSLGTTATHTFTVGITGGSRYVADLNALMPSLDMTAITRVRLRASPYPSMTLNDKSAQDHIISGGIYITDQADPCPALPIAPPPPPIGDPDGTPLWLWSRVHGDDCSVNPKTVTVSVIVSEFYDGSNPNITYGETPFGDCASGYRTINLNSCTLSSYNDGFTCGYMATCMSVCGPAIGTPKSWTVPRPPPDSTTYNHGLGS